MTPCPHCGTQNDTGRKFCINCGQRLAIACPVCSTINPPAARFCGECGTAFAAPAVAATTGTAATFGAGSGGTGAGPDATGSAAAIAIEPISERRLVSVLFVDLVGFTTASERRDAEDTRELLTRYYDTAREIVGRHGGVIEKFIGDAVMAVWGAPIAHEDDTERAVRTALELVNAVPRLVPAGESLRARGGVMTGEAAVSLGAAGQGMVAGDLVNTASRLQSIAEPGTILVGEATYRAASRAVAFEDLGARALKGKEGSVHVWQAVKVVALRGGEGRSAILEPPFIGRSDELQLLKDLFHATAREGKPRLVTVSGLPGIGKSRLIWELEKYLDGVVENVFWQEGRAPSYGDGISYWSLAEMVRARSGITDAADPSTHRQKVQEMVAGFVADEADRKWIEPRLLGLLGLEALPNDNRDELFAAWRTFFERMADREPLVLFFGDLHWADQGTLDFIEHVLAWSRASPILILAEARPELFDRRPTWGQGVRSATLVHLDPLASEEMAELLLALVPELPDEALWRIVGRSEGIPLYAVETLRMLLDQGILRSEGDHFVLSGDVPELAVPETLHALVAARLDALEPDQRAVLTDAAVLGLTFTLPALAGVGGRSPEAVEEVLGGLVRRELLLIDADPRSAERGQYRFLQAVVREVAYQSLGKRTRQARHLAAARYYEGLGDDEIAGVLATHYLAAFQAARTGAEADALAAQARVALSAAAERASALHDLLGALRYLEDAISVTTEVSDLAALHERAVTVAASAAELTRAYEHAAAARHAYVGLGDRLGILRADAAEASALLWDHRDQVAIGKLRAALDAVADLPPSAEAARAQTELSRALMLAGDPEAVPWADRVLAAPQVAAPTVLLEAIITKGTALQGLGRMVEAEALLRGAIAIADGGGHLVAGLRARNNLRVMLADVDLEDALAMAREVYDTAVKYGHVAWVSQAGASITDVCFRLGRWDDYIDEVRADIDRAEAFYRASMSFEDARRMTFRGDPVAAQEIVDRVLGEGIGRESEQTAQWLLATKAETQLAQGRPQEAFETARSAWYRSAEIDASITAAMYAAAALADRDRLEATRARWHEGGAGTLPMHRGLEAVFDCLAALAEGRWSDTSAAYATAVTILESVGNRTQLARFQLAAAHLGGSNFGAATEAAAAAEAFFADHGASGYVDRYRAAARGPKAAPKAARRAAARDASVRATG